MVIGAPHGRYFEGLVLGTTTLRAVRHAACPVLTVSGPEGLDRMGATDTADLSATRLWRQSRGNGGWPVPALTFPEEADAQGTFRFRAGPETELPESLRSCPVGTRPGAASGGRPRS
ncbi:MAG: universal stress protein [Acidobacteriia bacterium]|nr:universal stress protein [Terriglobia bacterium]